MIYKGDCLQIMPELVDQGIKVDMILCDLPYGTTACKWDTVIPFEPLWDCYKGLIKDNGAIVLFGSQPFTSALIMSNIKWFKYEWIWVKNIPSGFQFAKKQPMRKYENICIFGNEIKYYPIYEERSMNSHTYNEGKKYKQESEHFTSKNRITKKRSKKRTATNVLYFDKVHPSKSLHPTQKPVPLFEYLIKTYTNEGDLVLDNCAGSGTTAIACMNTNRKYICIEQDEKYFEVMKKRIETHVIQTELKLCNTF